MWMVFDIDAAMKYGLKLGDWNKTLHRPFPGCYLIRLDVPILYIPLSALASYWTSQINRYSVDPIAIYFVRCIRYSYVCMQAEMSHKIRYPRFRERARLPVSVSVCMTFVWGQLVLLYLFIIQTRIEQYLKNTLIGVYMCGCSNPHRYSNGQHFNALSTAGI